MGHWYVYGALSFIYRDQVLPACQRTHSWIIRGINESVSFAGFVGFADAECAEQAFTKMHESEAEGKKLKIDFPGRKVPVSRLIVKNLPTVNANELQLDS